MQELTELSGAWIGQSIQEGLRISEAIGLVFEGLSFRGEGKDKDGRFDLTGEYDPADHWVNMIRTYYEAPINPSQVGYPFVYIGQWNGYLISGRWMMSTMPSYGGTFEMWPEKEEEAINFAREIDLETLAIPVR